MEQIGKAIQEKIQSIQASQTESTKSDSNSSKESNCPYNLCDGTGIITEEENGRLTGRICKCKKQEAVSQRLEFASLNEKYKDMSFDDFKANAEVYNNQESLSNAKLIKESGKKFIRKFEEMKEKGKGLYLHSTTPGSGKTMIINLIGYGLVREHHVKVKFTTTSDLFNAIRKTYSNETELTTHDLIEAAREVEVLILDDIGQSSVKSDTNDKLYDILNHRLNKGKVTLFTSNCKIEELDYDFRIRNRIQKMAIPIQAPEESARRNIADKENKQALAELLE